MPRRRRPKRRRRHGDAVYGNILVSHFINCMMIDGKKSTAEGVFYKAMNELKKSGMEPMEVFKSAIDNVKPVVEVRSRRVGGATYQVPVDIRAERRTSLAMRWIIDAARERKDKRGMKEKLVAELIDASKKVGTAIKKRTDLHRMAEANRAFVHFRW